MTPSKLMEIKEQHSFCFVLPLMIILLLPGLHTSSLHYCVCCSQIKQTKKKQKKIWSCGSNRFDDYTWVLQIQLYVTEDLDLVVPSIIIIVLYYSKRFL